MHNNEKPYCIFSQSWGKGNSPINFRLRYGFFQDVFYTGILSSAASLSRVDWRREVIAVNEVEVTLGFYREKKKKVCVPFSSHGKEGSRVKNLKFLYRLQSHLFPRRTACSQHLKDYVYTNAFILSCMITSSECGTRII